LDSEKEKQKTEKENRKATKKGAEREKGHREKEWRVKKRAARGCSIPRAANDLFAIDS